MNRCPREAVGVPSQGKKARLDGNQIYWKVPTAMKLELGDL